MIFEKIKAFTSAYYFILSNNATWFVTLSLSKIHWPPDFLLIMIGIDTLSIHTISN
jgi:hypothetical protein